MSQTSEFGYFVDIDSSIACAANGPLDAVSARTVFSNMCHLSDEFGQCRVAYRYVAGWAPPGISAPFTNYPYLSWQFPITQRQNGDSYKLRIRIAGFANPKVTPQFRAVVGIPGTAGPLYGWTGAQDREFLTTVASIGTTDAWLLGASQGPAASGTLIYLPSTAIPLQTAHTPPTLGGVDTDFQQPYAQLTVYGTCGTASGVPQLTGVYVEEYVG